MLPFSWLVFSCTGLFLRLFPFSRFGLELSQILEEPSKTLEKWLRGRMGKFGADYCLFCCGRKRSESSCRARFLFLPVSPGDGFECFPRRFRGYLSKEQVVGRRQSFAPRIIQIARNPLTLSLASLSSRLDLWLAVS
jgi:hypothetical protein